MKFVKIKSYAMLTLLIGVLGFITYTLYGISIRSDYIQAAQKQSTYKLNAAYARGTIYDCNMHPLVGKTEKRIAAVAPSIEVVAYLNAELSKGDYTTFSKELENGKPFLLETPETLNMEGIEQFEIPVRYGENQLASHIIGYIDGEGNGVSGMEMAMDDILKHNMGELSCYYQVDALGRVIAGEKPRIVNTIKEVKSGVVLTLDENIQRTAEEAAKKLGAGAVVITEIPSAEVRGIVSVPGYSPDKIGEATQLPQSPLVNRAFSAYAPGSVFKLVSAAEQIEEEKDGYIYNCTGAINVDDMEFHCINNAAHGKVDLEKAIEKSCNCYFIDAVSKMGGQEVLKMAYNSGFGISTEYGNGLITSSGNLPSAAELLNRRALANFSFGQGELTVTPLQIAGLINAIASFGEYSEPKLIAGTANDEMELTPADTPEKMRVMKVLTAEKLQRYMETAVVSGTGKEGSSDLYTCGAKTGTAQTGVYSDGVELNHYWYAGYIKDGGSPRYSVVVFRESTDKDNGLTGQVFKEISEYLAKDFSTVKNNADPE